MTVVIDLKNHKCSCCKKLKFFGDFHKRKDRKSGRQSHCKECEKKRAAGRKANIAQHAKKSYKKNKAKVCQRSKLVGKAKMDKITEIKSTTPCMDCGNIYEPCQMDFDHREPEKKSFSLNQARWKKWEEIEKEMAKCDLICSNCHRLRTYNRGQNIDAARKGGIASANKKRAG
jgi:hypothetical protein